MPGVIETHIDRENDLTVYSVSGGFTAEQVGQAIEDFYAGEPTIRVLWDFTEATFENISATVPQQMAGASRQHAGERQSGGKTAMVFTTDVGYGLGRMFESMRISQESHVAYRTFRSREEAMLWLESDLDA
jgi:hypothetical protein